MSACNGPSYCECARCVADDIEHAYKCVVTDQRPSCALSLLALWERPWSSNALRWAAHVLQRAWNRGLDVLESGFDELNDSIERPLPDD